jgi:hypothetical protein
VVKVDVKIKVTNIWRWMEYITKPFYEGVDSMKRASIGKFLQEINSPLPRLDLLLFLVDDLQFGTKTSSSDGSSSSPTRSIWR